MELSMPYEDTNWSIGTGTPPAGGAAPPRKKSCGCGNKSNQDAPPPAAETSPPAAPGVSPSPAAPGNTPPKKKSCGCGSAPHADAAGQTLTPFPGNANPPASNRSQTVQSVRVTPVGPGSMRAASPWVFDSPPAPEQPTPTRPTLRQDRYLPPPAMTPPPPTSNDDTEELLRSRRQELARLPRSRNRGSRRRMQATVRRLERGLPESCQPATGTALSPAGRPYPWQATAPACPFTMLNMATGNLLTQVPVIGWQTLGRPVSFSIFHNTLGDEPGQPDVLGPKWTHSYSRRLVFNEGGTITLFTDDGGSIRFAQNSQGAYVSPAGFFVKLDFQRGAGPNAEDVYVLTYKNQDVDQFDAVNGRLLRLRDASGSDRTDRVERNWMTFQYEGNRLVGIEDPTQNGLTLEYDAIGEDGSLKLARIIAPPIGDPGEQPPREFQVRYHEDQIWISSARRDNPVSRDGAYWAIFKTAGAQLISVTDRINSMAEIEYDERNRPNRITLAANVDGERQTRGYTFSEYDFDPYACTEGGIGCYHVVCTSTITGVRISPGPDVTTYGFDPRGRLQSVVDSLNRRIVALDGYDRHNNPTRATNVLGGVTEAEYEPTTGNLIRLRPPIGGEWRYGYDGINNLTYIRDPLGVETRIEYPDPLLPNATNLTKPIAIKGDGVSRLTMQWGTDPLKDLGQLVKTLSPNFVQQAFHTWRTPRSARGPANEREVHAATFGIGRFGNRYAEIQDSVSVADATGNTYLSADYAKRTCTEGGLCDCPEPEIALEPFPQCCSGWSLEHVNDLCTSDSCSVEFDADGNPIQDAMGSGGRGGRTCITPDGLSWPVGTTYNGAGQPTFIPQPMLYGDGPAGYYFGYDALGRKTTEEARLCPGGTGRAQITSHIDVYFQHVVSWHYENRVGIQNRTYELLNHSLPPAQQDFLTISTVTWFDLAGRVTHIIQNGETTTFEYNDSTTLPAIVMRRANDSSSEYYVDVGGQIREIVHKGADGRDILRFVYRRDAKQRIEWVDEYVDGRRTAVTRYTYGSGHLTVEQLDADSSELIDSGKLYYSWFKRFAPPEFPAGRQLQPSDPNRLVREERRGENAYLHEYWYDAGGNRLVMRKSIPCGDEFDDRPTARPVELIRYNYAFVPNANDQVDPGASVGGPDGAPRPPEPIRHDRPALVQYGLGEPIPDEVLTDNGVSGEHVPPSRNQYGTGKGMGQDKLLSYVVYRYEGGPPLETTVVRMADGSVPRAITSKPASTTCCTTCCQTRPVAHASRPACQSSECHCRDHGGGLPPIDLPTPGPRAITSGCGNPQCRTCCQRTTTCPPPRQPCCKPSGCQCRSDRPGAMDELLSDPCSASGCGCTVTQCCTTCCRPPDCPKPSACAIIDPAAFRLARERFVVYDYNQVGGKMSQRYDWNLRLQTLNMTEFVSYHKGRLEEVRITRKRFLEEEQIDEFLTEKYAYNVFGDRVAILQCDTINVGGCKGFARLYDYVDGQVLVERTSNSAPEHSRPLLDSQLISVLTWGPLGLISRRGASLGEQDRYTLCNYTYLADAMGNVMALMDASGDVRLQHFDAFGNNIGGFAMMACDSRGEKGETGSGPEVMQTGQFNWRGTEGSMTDLVQFWGFAEFDADGRLVGIGEEEGLSTGLIYMVNRFYEPETGRFTQADPVRYGTEIGLGQNNRWGYGSNDPIHSSDPNGLQSGSLAEPGIVGLIQNVLAAILGGPYGDALLWALVFMAFAQTVFLAASCKPPCKLIKEERYPDVLRGWVTDCVYRCPGWNREVNQPKVGKCPETIPNMWGVFL